MIDLRPGTYIHDNYLVTDDSKTKLFINAPAIYYGKDRGFTKNEIRDAIAYKSGEPYTRLKYEMLPIMSGSYRPYPEGHNMYFEPYYWHLVILAAGEAKQAKIILDWIKK